MCVIREGSKRLGIIVTLTLVVHAPASAEVFTLQEWWGTIGLTYQQRWMGSDVAERKSQLDVSLNNQYYIWQPWFVTGTLGMTLTGSSASNMDTVNDRRDIGGDITTNVLPLSVFPLSLGYSKKYNSVSDTAEFINSSGEVSQLTNDVISTRYFITQKYLGKRTTYSASLHANKNESELTGTYSDTTKKFEVVRRDPHNDINFNVQHREDGLSQGVGGRDNKMVMLSHNFYPSQNFTVNNFASKINQHDNVDLDGDGVEDRYNTDIDQLSSTVSWRSADEKTHINSSLRYTGVVTDTQASESENLGANIGVGARYKISDNISSSAAATHNESKLNGALDVQDSYRLSLDYHSDDIALAEYKYNWGSSLEYYRVQSSKLSESAVGASVNHGISRSWRHGRRGQIRFNATQRLGQQAVSSEDVKPTLNQSVIVGYSDSGANITHYAQANYTEDRGVSGNSELSQMLNLNVSRQQTLTTRSSINGSLMHQITAYHSAALDTQTRTSSALVNYSHNYNFSFQSLNFNSALRYSMFSSKTSPDSESYAWDNTLRHQIGQLSTRLTLRTQKTNLDPHSTLLMLNVNRRF